MTWAPGDMALCVRGGLCTFTGSKYLVTDVCLPGESRGGFRNYRSAPNLRFAGLVSSGAMWADSLRFRKVEPEQHRANEPMREMVNQSSREAAQPNKRAATDQ